jgi:hypothetical protein
MYNGFGITTVFSPLNDDPLKGERVKQSPQQFGHNELTFARMFERHWNEPQPEIFSQMANQVGFMPLVDSASMAYGKNPEGPWIGGVPDWAPYYAFPDISGGLVKVRG